MLSGRLTGWGKVVFFCRPSSLQAKLHLFFLLWVPVLPPSLALQGFSSAPHFSLLCAPGGVMHVPSCPWPRPFSCCLPTNMVLPLPLPCCSWLGFLSLCHMQACSGHPFHTRPSGRQDRAEVRMPRTSSSNGHYLQCFVWVWEPERSRHPTRHLP